jgi:hypothetical protein
MSLTPLKINTLGSFLQNQGLRINPTAVNYMGTSTSNASYTPGVVVSTTVLSTITTCLNLAYNLLSASSITSTVYNNLISIGSTTIPALGNSKPSTYTLSYTGDITRHGFLRLIPLQAYTEFYVNNGSYSDFVSTFNTCNGKKSLVNGIIKPLAKSRTFLNGIYSNMNDLITSDITGVNLSTFYWGQDLIASGRAIDLKNIATFGNPSVLLKTLSKNNAMTQALNTFLYDAGFTSASLDNLLNDNEPITLEQEKTLYDMFTLITGSDLSDICTILNCQTPNLDTLADLLNIKKLFPNSFRSLTFPKYNSKTLPTNSKTYYLIYSEDSVNRITGIGVGDRLNSMLPLDIAYSCDAFSIAMLQIKNIQNMNIEKFSQVVTNIENVNGLGVNGTNVPVDVASATYAYDQFAKGSGPDNTYTMCDFFGSMTDLHYSWTSLEQQIQALQSSALVAAYNNIYSLLIGPGPYTTLQDLINIANNEIDNIMTANASKASLLNATYDSFGTKLTKEKNARSLALPTLNFLTSDTTDTYLFVTSLDNYGVDTEPCETCAVLTSIADTTLLGGNSLIASMREARNAKRLGYMGGTLDNEIDTVPLVLPRATGSTTNVSPIPGYNNCSTLGKIPIITGAATVPGSLAGSPETTLIPSNLAILVEPNCQSVLVPKQAVEDVILCNCDCWENL